MRSRAPGTWRPPGAVGEDPEQLEQFGPPLDLVDDDQSRQPLQGLHRCLKTPEVDRVLEVEDFRASGGGQLSRQRCLARLARADESHDRMNAERGANGFGGSGARNHATMILENQQIN